MAHTSKKLVTLLLFLNTIPIMVSKGRGVASNVEQLLLHDKDISLTIPLLFDYGNCSSLCASKFHMEYGFHLSSQQYNVNNPGSVTARTVSSACKWTPSPQFTDGPYTIEESHSFHYYLENSTISSQYTRTLCYQCRNKVFSIYFTIDNPTFSMIFSLFGQEFNHSFAVFPTPSDVDYLHNPMNNSYHYDVLFSSASFYANTEGNTISLDGITIQAIHDKTKIKIELTSDVIAIKNAKKHKHRYYHNQTKYLVQTLCAHERLWIEPMVTNCTANSNNIICVKASLKSTKITSSKPIMVFTNKAMVDSSQHFSYKTQLVHQLPERRNWGKRFIVDTQQVRILPMDKLQHTLKCNILVLVLQNTTEVSITYHYLNRQKATDVEKLYAHTSGEILHSLKSNRIIKATVSHIDISATHPVMVMYELYTETASEPSGHLSYSVLLQPIEWYNNIQTVVLSHHSQPSTGLKYHVSVAVPKAMYDPKNILLSPGTHFCDTTPLDEYKGFSGQIFHSDDYIVFYLESTHFKQRNETQLLIRHSNPEVVLGVTVFTYSQDLHYAYSNGYAYKSEELKVLGCAESVASKVKGIMAGSLPTVLVIVLIVSIGLCCWKKRRRGVERGFTQIQPTQEPDPDYYDYDAFLIFMNEDEIFVREYIFEPLTRIGYKLLWHYDCNTHLFKAGNNVIDDVKEAMQISRKVVFICTKYFTDVDREVTYCKDEQARVKQRRILPIVIEEEFASEHFKKYTQIRLKQRTLNIQEENDLLTKLKKNLGPPKQQRTENALDSFL